MKWSGEDYYHRVKCFKMNIWKGLKARYLSIDSANFPVI